MAQGTTGALSLRRPPRPGLDIEGTSMTVGRFGDAEWEAKEALRQRELEESRARAAQMEKTMRWWSDCTANWREKWSKVRNERNKAREEARVLRNKLDSAVKDSSALKREKAEIEAQNDELKKEIERIHMLLIRHAGQWDQKILEALDLGEGEKTSNDHRNEDPFNLASLKTSLDIEKASTSTGSEQLGETDACSEDGAENEVAVKEAAPENLPVSPSGSADSSDRRSRRISPLRDDLSPYDEETLLQKLSMLQHRLTEATKTIQAERDEKSGLHKNMERLQSELQEARDKCEDLRQARQDAVRELLSLQDTHRDTMQQIQADLQDETSNRESVDRRMADLRAELERLQAENAAEWGKRERLETEKLALERENKKLRSEVRDLQDRLERRGQPQHSADTELRTLQQELSERNKELVDLKHSHSKIKKILNDKVTELAHAARRAEQYESEVKRLRARVEELKRECAVAEDEVDSAMNNIRKLQRSNDELQEQVENMQVQLGHLHTRLRSNSTTAIRAHRIPSPIHNQDGGFSDDEGAEY